MVKSGSKKSIKKLKLYVVGGTMRKVLAFILCFLLLFLLFDPINLKSEEPSLITIKDPYMEKITILKLENFNVKNIDKLDLKIRKLTSLKNGKEFVYNYTTNTTYETIMTSYEDFLKNNNYTEDIMYSKSNGFLVDKITVLDNLENIKVKLKNINYEVIK